jgi:hypothetical protein
MRPVRSIPNLYSSPRIIRIINSKGMKWAGNVASMGDKQNAHMISAGNPEGKGPLGRLRLKWEGNIKMYLRETGWGGMDWVDLAQDRDQWRALVNIVMNLRV